MKKTFDAKMMIATAAAAILLAAATSVKAQTISWNFDGYGTINGGSQYAGVVSAANWNDTYLIDGNSGNPENNLIDNSGNATTLGASFTDNSQYGYAIQFSSPAQDADGSYNKYLLNGYLNNGNGGSVAIALSSIPYSSYNIVVYLSSDTAGRTGTVNIGGTTYDFSSMGPAEISGINASLIQTTDTSGANPSADYAIFSGLSGASQTITTTIPAYGGIAGFQIVATPEPSSMALAGMGGALILLMSRRLKRLRASRPS
jgi:hypothetical protein